MEETNGPPPTLWERSRQLAGEAIVDTAVRLFTEQGYEETTIAQIAREAGVSQRTLFRYFGSKEDLLGGDQDALAERMRRAVADQPDGATAWDALRAGFGAVLAVHSSPQQALARMRLVFETPSLHAAYIEKRLRWQAELLPVVQARMGIAADGHDHGRGHDRDHDPRARAVIAASFACADAAMQTWVAGGGEADVHELYDQCVAAIRTPADSAGSAGSAAQADSAAPAAPTAPGGAG